MARLLVYSASADVVVAVPKGLAAKFIKTSSVVETAGCKDHVKAAKRWISLDDAETIAATLRVKGNDVLMPCKWINDPTRP